MNLDDLKIDIERLLENFSREIRNVDYDQIKVAVEDRSSQNNFIDGRIPILKTKVYSIEEYSQEYHSQKNKGYSWINLQLAGMHNNELIIVISYPARINNIEKTSVNFSGPFVNVNTGKPELNFDKKYILL